MKIRKFKMKIFNFVFLFLLFLTANYLQFMVSIAHADWSSIGTGGGGAMFLPHISPYNPDIMTVTCDMGGYYITTDGGVSWKMINLGSLVYATDFDYSSDTIYAGVSGNSRGVYKTSDGGANWQSVMTGSALSGYEPVFIAVDPSDSNYIWVALGYNSGFTYGGGGEAKGTIYKLKYTTNGGTSWTDGGTGLSLGSSRRIRKIFIDRNSSVSSRTVYVGIGGGSYGVYKSVDGGATFSSANGSGLPSTNITDFAGGCNTTAGTSALYVSIDGQGVYKSTNGGAVWAKSSALSITSLNGIEVSGADSETVYVMVWDGYGIYKTSNGGASWAGTVFQSNFTDGWVSDKGGWQQGYPQHGFSVSQSNPANIVWTDYSRFAKSLNSGTSWTQHYTNYLGDWETTGVRSRGLEVNVFHDIVFNSDKSKIFFPMTDQGLWMSEDGGATLKFRGDGTNWNWYSLVIDADNSDKVYAGVGVSNDIPVQLPEVGTQSTGKLMVSTNYGSSWSDANSGLPNDAVMDILIDPTSAAGSRTMYVATMGSGVYKSTNGGASWSAVNTGIGTNKCAYKLTRTSDGTIYLVVVMNSDSTIGALYKTTDDGANWQSVSIASTNLKRILDVKVHPTDLNTIYICGFATNGTGGVFRSINGGTSWTRVLSKSYVYQLTVDSRQPDLIYATICEDSDYPSDGGVYCSTNKGDSWNQLSDVPFRNIKKVILDPDDINKIYLATWGGGVLTNSAVVMTYSISGYVKDGSGTAISGATVGLSGTGNNSTTTDASGYYQFLSLSTGTYTVTPSKTNWGFSPVNLSINVTNSNKTNQNFTGTYLKYIVSGYVKDGSNLPISGATVNLSGSVSTNTTTSALGFYSFTDLSSGTYTVAPSKQNYIFTPSNIVFNPLNATQSNQNFTATYTLYYISGYILDQYGNSLPDINVDLSGADNQSSTTNGSGYYSFVDLSSGVYTVTPGKTDWTITPSTKIYNPLAADQANQDFTGQYSGSNPLYNISGYIRNSSSTALENVTITISGSTNYTKSTSSSGYFSFMYLPAGSYVISPAKTNYSFSPSSLNYTSLNADQPGQNFTGAFLIYSISGYVRDGSASPIIGALLTLSGDDNYGITTDTGGYYSFTNLNTGTYTITPSKTNYSFSPDELTYSPLNASRSDQNYEGTYIEPAQKYSIDGYIKDSSNTSIEGVTLMLSGTVNITAVSDSSGYYEFSNLNSGDYLLMPVKTDWSFTPSSKTYTITSSNYTNQYFIAKYTVDSTTVIAVNSLKLRKNLFNPLKNEKVQIIFNLEENAQVDMEIYKLSGILVNKLMEGKSYTSGQHTFQWDGTDTNGEIVPAGIYAVSIRHGSYAQKKKICVIK
ncbi:MAG: hypothetical protein A2252_02245 [Elusimicrobia bacterium RIFOXYA2_FULL_39_19]|nr:MAG: hypothetical protein A2252_02245 [Elusimicrobia bacterium RIFOXYA2_FULL_39_19]